LVTTDFTVSKCSLQKLSASIQVSHFVGTGSGSKMRLASATYRTAFDVRLSETLFCH
jgi:hypothetical protein